MVCYISILPNDILKAIFCRVPIASLINCRSVCKSWHQNLMDHNIGNIHPSEKNPTTLFLCLKKGKLYWLEFDGDHPHFDLAATIIKKPFWHPPKFVFLNSCKGLLCLCQDYNTMHVINPITSEYINLPLRDDQRSRLFPNLCGIGFDPKRQKFKVVRTTISDSRLKCEVCTLGDGTWRSIRGLISGDFNIDSLGAFVNGSLHCLFRSESNLRMCAFDCQSETFKELSLPPIHDDYRPINIGATDKFLYFSSYCVSVTGSIFNVTVWVMKEYGVIESWTKMEGRQNGFKLDGMMFIKNVQILENGSVLLHLPPYFVIYYPPEGMFQKFGPTQEIQSTISPIFHTPSFASLKAVVGDSLEVLKARKGEIKLETKMWITSFEVCFFLLMFPVWLFIVFFKS